jgi:beta-N-acetylhexosaminidase
MVVWRRFFRFCVLMLLCVLPCSLLRAQSNALGGVLPIHHPWVDSVYQSLSPDARIAQLIWPMVEQLNVAARFSANLNTVRTYQPGGILYMKNSADDIARFNNSVHQVVQVPLLTAIDGEWGLAMRVDGVTAFPKAMTLGAVQNPKLLYAMGLEVANQMKQVGINVNFAPVADVNCNPLNPVIGTRSFGENPHIVAERSVMYMLGMQNGGLLAVAKHFPGHGDTHTDSHLALPKLDHSRERFDSLELVPFNALIKNGIGGVMSAHLEIPALESTIGVPASLSKSVVTDLLKVKMGFSGLVITDAMNMKGVKVAGKPGRVDVLALMAGNDVVEASESIGLAITEVKMAIEKEELGWDDIEEKCRKVLAMKFLLGATHYEPVRQVDVAKHINASTSSTLIQELYDASLTVLKQKRDTSLLGADSVAVLVMPGQKVWRDSLAKYCVAKFFEIKTAMTAAQVAKLKKDLASYKRVVWIMDRQASSKSIWSDAGLATLKREFNAKGTLYCVFAQSPYQLKGLAGAKELQNLIVTYEDVAFNASSVARCFSGMMVPSGKVPVSVQGWIKEGDGVSIGFNR